MPLLTTAQSALRRLDPERAHDFALRAMHIADRARLLPTPRHDPRLARTIMGLHFPTPIGLAAGFDKNASAPVAWASLGFGFVEIGTVTPRPQSGNPRPRLFRLEADRAVINRMGFNNEGIGPCLARLRAHREAGRITVPLGVNVGINKEGADPDRDYPALVAAASEVADYVVINISSPNTPGLRDLQATDRLRAILDAVGRAMPPSTRLLVKLAPDGADDAIAATIRAVIASPATGLILTNTTIARPAGLHGPHTAETGGLSGAPLAARAQSVLQLAAAERASTPLVLIACGGIATGADIARRLAAGADLVQLYTAFAYEGPALLARLERELLALTPKAPVR